MQVLKNLFGLNKKIASSEIAIKNEKDNSSNTLDTYLSVKTIYDSGTNENGNWIRYNDGTMICSNTVEVSVIINQTLSSSLYYGYVDNVGYFPQTFIERPNIIFNHHTSSSIFAIQPYNITSVTTTKTGGIYPICPFTTSGYNYFYVSYIAIGRWK